MMQLTLDVVDILQLQEVWSRRPVVTAFTRLEGRPALLPCAVDFKLDNLMPRLARLKHSTIWRSKNVNPTTDPARVPLRDLSEEYLNELYPEAESMAALRQSLFISAYNRFVIAHYRGDVEQSRRMLQALAQARQIEVGECLNAEALPRQGSSEWIPADIIDEIRGLDERYDTAEPGLPAAFVVSENFWPLLVKAEPRDLDEAARLCFQKDASAHLEASRAALARLTQVAYAWNRSPSVVGLCYQVSG